MHRYPKLFLLALLPLILASAAIAWAGWRVVKLQQESDVQSAKKGQEQTAADIGRDVVARLNGKLWAATQDPWSTTNGVEPAIVLTGFMDNGRLRFPWDPDPLDGKAQAFDRAIHATDFWALTQEAGLADLQKDYPREIGIYRGLVQTTSDANQREDARLRLAWTFMRAGRQAEGLDLFLELLALPSDVVDELSRPLALSEIYAAGGLLLAHSPTLDRKVLDRVRKEIDALPLLVRSGGFLTPLLDELQKKSADSGVRADALAAKALLAERMEYMKRMRAMPQARLLQTTFPLGVPRDTWQAFPGEETWLVGMTPARDGMTLVLAVRAEDIRRTIAAERGMEIAFAVGGDEGYPLHESLPGLRVTLPPAPAPRTDMGLPLLFALALALVGILLPACLGLLWRDTRRDVRLADLRSQFVSSVSHELKTPLTAIRMLAETMQMRAASAEKQAQYLDTIVDESERLTRLLNNVLDFSRIERGQKGYHLQPAALADAVKTAARTMRFPLAEMGFDLRVDIADSIPPAPIDRDAIEQAVLNLLSNAMKYSGESRDIALSLSRRNGHALIRVEDHGIGIPVEEQKRIFERFYRVPTPENRAVSGTGLGLALVAHIAEAHGGGIDVESTPGQGSTFSLRIPLQQDGGVSV